jgi:CRP-like cAMP-binding protein
MVQKRSNGHLQNRLLAALPPQAFSLFKSDLHSSTFKQGAIVQEAGEPVDQIYFPQTGMISLLVVTQEGVGIEAATIGREGAVGLHRGLGKRRAFTRAVIQVSGTISHISANVFERAVEQSATIKRHDYALHRGALGRSAADCRMQRPSRRGSAACPMVAANARPN